MVTMLKLTPYRQSPSYCGPASLRIVLEFFGLKKTEAELGRLSGCTKKQGVGAKGLLKAASELDFAGFVKDNSKLSDIQFFLNKKIPVIVDWFSGNDGHYSVVAGLDKKYIHLADPEVGKIHKIGLETFERVWFDFPGNTIINKNDIILRRLIVIIPKTKKLPR